MSKESTTTARRPSDGTLVEVLPDGSTRPLADETDWQRLRAMTDAEVEAAASSDPDAQPLTGGQLARVPHVKTLRRALRLTQEELAGDCQEFRVRAMTMGRKEPAHGTPQSTAYPGRAVGPASGRR